MVDAVGSSSAGEEVYVFGHDGRGACIYSNAVAQDMELFRWTCAGNDLTFEPLRSVWVREGRTAQERSCTNAATVRYSVTSERNEWGDALRVLRLDPARGLAPRYAKSLLTETQRHALRDHVGLDLGPEFATPLRTQSW
jgi:hypothetical protein